MCRPATISKYIKLIARAALNFLSTNKRLKLVSCIRVIHTNDVRPCQTAAVTWHVPLPCHNSRFYAKKSWKLFFQTLYKIHKQIGYFSPVYIPVMFGWEFWHEVKPLEFSLACSLWHSCVKELTMLHKYQFTRHFKILLMIYTWGKSVVARWHGVQVSVSCKRKANALTLVSCQHQKLLIFCPVFCVKQRLSKYSWFLVLIFSVTLCG